MNDIKKMEKFARIVDLAAITSLLCLVVSQFLDGENATEAQLMATTLSLLFVSLGRIAHSKIQQNIIAGLMKDLTEKQSNQPEK